MDKSSTFVFMSSQQINEDNGNAVPKNTKCNNIWSANKGNVSIHTYFPVSF